MKVKTRFAPSPTGDLHIGGARTALFNYLFAKHHGGSFLIRIEDTDKERSTKRSVDLILESLGWIDIRPDEKLYYQSERYDIYKKYLDILLNTGKVYRCICTKEELDAKKESFRKSDTVFKYDRKCRDKNYPADIDKPFTIRIASESDGISNYKDLIRGEVTFNNNDVDDIIIVRSDGSPTYNFAVAIDDYEMGITDVIRGNDHISNTPKQIAIYKGLNFDIPTFTHISMVLGPGGKRLSKRDGALSILEYKERGILPTAFVNYIARLGWAYEDKEIVALDELIELFDISRLSLSAAQYDETKLFWLNSEYMKKEDPDYLADQVINRSSLDPDKKEFIKQLIPLITSRSRDLNQLADSVGYFISSDFEYDEKAVKKIFTKEAAEYLVKLVNYLQDKTILQKSDPESLFTEFMQIESIELKQIAQPTRLALTGRTVSCGIYDIIYVIGKDESISRIKRAIEFIRKNIQDPKS